MKTRPYPSNQTDRQDRQTNPKPRSMGIPASVPSVTEDTVWQCGHMSLESFKGCDRNQFAVIVCPRGRQVQHFSSLDCVINMNPGPALLGLRLRASCLSSLVFQSLKLQRRVLNRPNLRGLSQKLTEAIMMWGCPLCLNSSLHTVVC